MNPGTGAAVGEPKNKEEHGVINKLIVLANKCDELSFNGWSFKIMDDELSEMYQQIELTVFQKVQEIDNLGIVL